MSTAVELPATEAVRLVELEAVIDQGLASFVEVGQALAEISTSRLYRVTHGSFAEYAADRFGLGRSHAYRMIDAAKVAEAVSPMGDSLSERQARELKGLPPNIAQASLAVAKGVAMVTRGSMSPTAEEIATARAQVTASPVAAVPDRTPEEAREYAERLTEAIRNSVVDESTGELLDEESVSAAVTQQVTAPRLARPAPKPKRTMPYRKPLPEVAKNKGFALRDAMDAVSKIFDDNRYQQNTEQVALALRGHLLYVSETVAAVLDQLPS